MIFPDTSPGISHAPPGLRMASPFHSSVGDNAFVEELLDPERRSDRRWDRSSEIQWNSGADQVKTKEHAVKTKQNQGESGKIKENQGTWAQIIDSQQRNSMTNSENHVQWNQSQWKWMKLTQWYPRKIKQNQWTSVNINQNQWIISSHQWTLYLGPKMNDHTYQDSPGQWNLLYNRIYMYNII